jgi:hypothetical protein
MDTVTNWGWQNKNRPAGVLWVAGTLEESFLSVSRHGGRWVLVSADPSSEYRRVMAETEKEMADGRS